MFDMGFEPQVTLIVENTRPDRQTVLFSATFPRQMELLARRILSTPLEVTVGLRAAVCTDVEQHVVVLQDNQRFLKLLELLGTFLIAIYFWLLPYEKIFPKFGTDRYTDSSNFCRIGTEFRKNFFIGLLVAIVEVRVHVR